MPKGDSPEWQKRPCPHAGCDNETSGRKVKAGEAVKMNGKAGSLGRCLQNKPPQLCVQAVRKSDIPKA